MKISKKNIERIKELCKEYRVKNFSVFGSVLTDRFSSDSDIDFMVDFLPENRDFFEFQINLTK
jgi:uncharacterized protein